jgi:hypothetical protein
MSRENDTQLTAHGSRLLGSVIITQREIATVH